MCLAWWSNAWTICELFYCPVKEQETQYNAITSLVLNTFVKHKSIKHAFLIYIITATDLYIRASSHLFWEKKK